MKFSRKIKFTDPIIPYKPKDEKDENKLHISSKEYNALVNSCHWGALKLLYSEIEFLLLVSKYIDINECLVVYIGAQPGYRLKNLFMKSYFPKINMLLYDPLPFDITETDQIIIKTGDEGWFSDEKIEEVLKIANGRKILLISDIRLSDDDAHVKESLIHDDMQKQQKWGIMMGADFMLLKFRMFFYKTDPKEVDFINNYITEQYNNKIKYIKDEKKHSDIHNWLLYLDGSIFTQLYAPIRSTEARLFVKKIKYYKDADTYDKKDQEKYKMIYYDNILYEGLFNYFNLETRNKEIEFGKSRKMVKYIPGQKVSYTTASEYYIIKQYLKFKKEEITLKNVLNKIIEIYTFLNTRYNNNLIICGLFKTLKKYKYDNEKKDIYHELKNRIEEHVNMLIKTCNKQFKMIKNTKLIDTETKKNFIKSFKTDKNEFFTIENGTIKKN
jgi:hypothetical protein